MKVVSKLINNRATRRKVFQSQDRFRGAELVTWEEVYGKEYLDFLWDNKYIQWNPKWKVAYGPQPQIIFTSKGDNLFVWFNYEFKYIFRYFFRKYILRKDC